MRGDPWKRLLPDAPRTLRDILDPRRGAPQPPIRSEIFGPERFAQHGRSLGQTHRAERAALTAATFFPRLRTNIRVLREAHHAIGEQAATGYDVSPAAEWLLDNFHLIEAQLEQIRDALPRSYFRSLPLLQDEPLAGLPRIYGVAWAFVAHTDGAFDDELLAHFLNGYQETRELSLREMWALPTTLRVLLIENLRRLAERVACNKAAREVANLCADRIETFRVSVLDEVLALLVRRGVGRMFLTQLSIRLRDRRAAADEFGPPGLEAWLHAALPDLAEAQTQHLAGQTADNLSVSNAVTSLRTIGDADWPDIVGRASVLMQRMLASPLFEAEHPDTRDRTLHDIERLARRSGRSELVVAQTLLEHMSGDAADGGDAALASHWLRGPGRAELCASLGLDDWPAAPVRALVRRAALPAYLLTLLGASAVLVAWLLAQPVGASGPWIAAAAVLMFFPASEAVTAVVHRLVSESARPSHLPRLAWPGGIPAAHRVIVVIPALLGGAETVAPLVHRLLLHALANPEPEAQFALLSDWADADAEHLDSDAALLDLARQQIADLNTRHPAAAGAAPRFLLLHRERRFSETERRWIGWERKRGKLEQLVAALATGEHGAFLDLGELSSPARATRYIVTLDADTQLPPGRLRDLVAVAAHPQNRPRLDRCGRRVVSGFGILQPHLVTPLPTAREATPFHWLFAGQCGIDPYSAASSDVYQDLFGEGSFSGKGLLDVQALHTVLHARLPEGQVLSHDLLEGAMARCAVVTDISLIENAPFHADMAASRVHRWTRGDWQLLPILFAWWRFPLGAVSRWKMFDNLRRSLVAPMALGLVVLALAGHGVSPWAALALVLAAFAAGPLLGAVAAFVPRRHNVAVCHFVARAASELARALLAGAWHLAQLLPQALQAADAIVRALWRTVVSRRHLLQWTTAAAAEAEATTEAAALWRRHGLESLVALLLLAVLLVAGTPHPALAVLLCGVWACGPLWTRWVSRPRRTEAPELPDAARHHLHEIARDTWRLFERCVGPDDRHLPPDNLQMLPHDMVAHRTSPTNIGLYLLSAACARSFGWIGTQDLLARLEATLATLATLPRHRGHLLNWYDTQTGAPLLPMYVSTVDSGNLGGHLLAVASACREFASRPHDGAAPRRALARSRARLAPGLAARHRCTPAARVALRWALADHGRTRRSALRDALAALRADGDVDARARLLALAGSFERLAFLPEYGFLYHRRRRLFHIGFRVAEQQIDAGFYDLLASESRLTSLLAVAKGDVPVAHWAALGRPFFGAGAGAGLRSWSGSMFEYLMPTLVLDEPPGSVLRDAARAAVDEQIAFGHDQAAPWGISESAHAGCDHTLAYQYAPQGVPRLALRRTPPDELVVAPYATALAAMVAPLEAARNFADLEAMGTRARYGFIEALDFSAARQGGGEAFTPVITFMAHHQGMTIVALANVLLGGTPRRWGMANPSLQAVTSLLHERAPREVSVLPEPATGPPVATQRSAPRLLRHVSPGASAIEPTQVLSNGRYTVLLRPNGAGESRWGATGLTRCRDDALRDACGSFFYLRRPGGDAVSITQHPAPDAAAHYHSVFHADRVCFDAAWPAVQAHATVWVSPEDDIELRRVEVRNLGERVLEIELISAFEPTLADPRADEAHPAFSNLFLSAQWQPAQQALLFERRPRLAHERGLLVAHFIAGFDPQVVGVSAQTDRARWLGRNRPASRPLAEFDAVASGTFERREMVTGLDPVCALAVRLSIAPGAKAELTFATAASDDAATLRAVIDKHRQPSHVQRTSLMSATLAGVRLRALGIGAENFAVLQTLTTALVQTITRPLRAVARDDAPEACDRRTLWAAGISGDRPIVLVSAGVLHGRGLLRSLAQALRLWAWGGIACDLVIVNAEPASYQMDLQHELAALRDRHLADSAGTGGPNVTALHVVRADDLPPGALGTLQRLARLRLNADGRPLLYHLREWQALHEAALVQRQAVSTAALAPVVARTALAAPKGLFEGVDAAFGFDVSAERRPPRPWINVLSNPGFGAQLSEAGGGFSWAVNSRLHQLTGWSNDPVADPPSEWFLIQDLRSLDVWSVTAGAWGDARIDYRVVHGQGFSRVTHRRGDLEIMASWCVDAHHAVKQVVLRITHRGTRTTKLRLAAVAEWTMGAGRADRGTVRTAFVRQRLPAGRLTALAATQLERSAGFGGGTAFLGLATSPGDDVIDWTCDRRECFDAAGQAVLPDHFGQRAGDGLDPCAALSTRFELAPGQTIERVFLIGWAASSATARELATLAAAVPPAQRADDVTRQWDGLLGATTVKTPDPLFDALVNRWLLYQAVSCRLWAKAGFYQAGGATGFRDQLQDALALAWAAPAMLRAQIVRCASRQFAEGDVQHWWHAPLGAGVRTRFSDDLLWLPHACAHYLRTTGDAGLLDEHVAFLDGPAVAADAEDHYDTPAVSAESASVYEHAARAIDHSLRVGVHGLPLMGTGDWNDGMNRVGHGGQGESVWLAWFLCSVVADFAPLARARGEADRALLWERAAIGWKEALQGPAWDGAWYRRAFFDDGSPLGSQANAEARIDLIAQAWAVLSDVAPPERQRLAMDAVESHLVNAEAGVLRLLDPPLVHAVPSAGYLQAYPPGVRENGGQYSHAGVWALMAQARLHGGADDAARVWRDFTWLSPAHRSADARHGAAYGLEPYAMAGDVYSQPPYVGRGGWSWYTGAAAWLHRAAIDSIFGLKLDADVLRFEPCIPPHWDEAELTLRRDGRTMRFVLSRDAARAGDAVRLSPGEALCWTELPSHSRFVVPIEAESVRQRTDRATATP